MHIYRDSHLYSTQKKDKEYLEKTRLPIVTVSSSYLEDLKGFHDYPETDTTQDVVFSRAHYSMALAVAVQVWQKSIDPTKAWVVDPTNYVKIKQWPKITFTENVGKLLARTPLLKKVKDLADKFARNKLPILESIKPALLDLTKDVKKPILSFHIASGNILAETGKQVVQMVTDPHVREDYLNQAQRKNISFLVFDHQTKIELLNKAKELNKKVDQNRVIVTGPPVDPRIVQYSQNKQIWQNGVLRLCITTGGLGTNKGEIKQLLQQLLPELQKNPSPYQILVYAGTHQDIYQMVADLAESAKIKLNKITAFDPANFIPGGNLNKLNHQQSTKLKIKNEKLSVIYHPQIMDANELLVHLAFPWADGFISKPSGDMAYDAVASGSFLLTLQEWGEWEHNIRQIFADLNIAKKARVEDIVAQLEELRSSNNKELSWIEQAMRKAKEVDPLFTQGVKRIVEVVRKLENK